MNIADKIFQIIEKYSDTIFFLPGGGCSYLVDALGNNINLKRYTLLNEQSCGFAAVGYAQSTGKLGVCLVTTGPGSLNVLNPVGSCWTDSVPVLFISGQARTETLVGNSGMRTAGIQEVDIIPVVKSLTKKSIQLTNNKNLENIVEDLIKTSLTGRQGPCWLSVPLDVQMEEYV